MQRLLAFFVVILYSIGHAYGESSAGHNAKPVKAFVIFNEMRFQDQPDIRNQGFKDIRVVYTAEMWGKSKKYEQPDLSYLDRFVQTKINPTELVCIDIEHWSLDSRRFSESEINENIDKYIAIIRKFKEHNPDSAIGMYAMLPIRDYHSPVKERDLDKWHAANASLARLAEEVDIIFPSIYTFYKDQEGWVKYAIANINEAKKYGKPVIPFMWPQYHGSNKFFAYDTIAKDYWRLQLETVFEHADGLVLWSPAGEKQTEWDEDAEWWEATQEFIQFYQLDQRATPPVVRVST